MSALGMERILITVAIMVAVLVLPDLAVRFYRRWQGRCPRCGSIAFDILQNDGSTREVCGERCGWLTTHG